jgi:hypothetical protein
MNKFGLAKKLTIAVGFTKLAAKVNSSVSLGLGQTWNYIISQKGEVLLNYPQILI